MKLANFAGGLAVAVVLTAPFIVPAVAGIATWKVLLALIGLGLISHAGISRPS